MNHNYYIAVFESKNKAVYLYSMLENIGYTNFQLISTPCALKVGCNYSIKFTNIRNVDALIREAKELGVGVPIIYFAEKADGKYKYKKINI